jgi:hypothetical protein
MKAILDKKRINISLLLLAVPRLSRSGKSFLVATSRGTRKTNIEIGGKPVYVSASAFIRKRQTHPKKRATKKR